MASIDWHDQIKSELYAVNERAMIIVACAMIHDKLMELLIAHLKQVPKGKDNLFGPMMPLGTFSSVTELAYRLRIVDSKVRSALNLLRKIRNDCAHTTATFYLNQSPHKDRIAEIGNLLYKLPNPSEDNQRIFVIALVLKLVGSIDSALRNKLDLEEKNKKRYESVVKSLEGDVIAQIYPISVHSMSIS